MIGAPPSTEGGVQPNEMIKWLVSIIVRVGGAGGTPLFRLTVKFRMFVNAYFFYIQ